MTRTRRKNDKLLRIKQRYDNLKFFLLALYQGFGKTVLEHTCGPLCFNFIISSNNNLDLCLHCDCLQELRGQLDAALLEIEGLHKARDRQKEMVQAIVNQRDMYRSLLAQNTPLPGDSPRARRTSGMHVERDSAMTGDAGETEEEDEATKQLEEVKEQFEAYRKEKAENDKILHQQLEEMREQTSSMRLDNAKLSSKV